LILHGILNLGSEQVMRFLGKQLTGQFEGEVVTDLRRREDGVRLKHWVNENSIKLYNCLNVLRPETTINDAEDLKVFRTPETRPDAPMAWYPLRRGVADLYRRAQISRAANQRYLTALAAASDITPLAEEAAKVCQPVRADQRRHRALNPFEAADAQLLAAVNRTPTNSSLLQHENFIAACEQFRLLQCRETGGVCFLRTVIVEIVRKLRRSSIGGMNRGMRNTRNSEAGRLLFRVFSVFRGCHFGCGFAALRSMVLCGS
jgi:hypothetical protein